ncbi:cellular retinaldehyde-binding/triple function domain-containing protein [Tieghemostelium lacteum]|uniref:Cellular retinaldehyde-binding/triple function domain-containing protein n=1 Tax=Tieghemostelium lacteum TaxID=361077 RepID=A0A152A0K2_TIELA|nr:cellular retinaldehyde-binding/triple function domain-containing protein [Tieghemostelium lacteum]|eukprot:KYQ99755.1 cellular retinaldehyde-binding/triple function domain-containing protein [Tieghemostelium lacteum]
MSIENVTDATLHSVSTPTLGSTQTFNPFKNLNEKQMEAFNEIKSNLSDLTDPEDIAFINDMCLLRYLRARNYTVAKSEKMIRDSLEWRKKNRPQDICLKDLKAIANTGCLYIHSKDKKGRPIILARPRRDTVKDVPGDIKFKHLVYWLESGFKNMDYNNGVETFCFIVDYHGFSRGNMDMKTNLESMHFLLDHCPERLGQAIFLDPPTLFWIAWKIISPFLNEVTMSKVKFVYSKKDKDGNRVFPELLEYIDATSLEKDLGGEMDYNFDFDQYLIEHPDPIVSITSQTSSNITEGDSANNTTTTTNVGSNGATTKKEKKEKEKLEKKEKKDKEKLEKKLEKEKSKLEKKSSKTSVVTSSSSPSVAESEEVD